VRLLERVPQHLHTTKEQRGSAFWLAHLKLCSLNVAHRRKQQMQATSAVSRELQVMRTTGKSHAASACAASGCSSQLVTDIQSRTACSYVIDPISNCLQRAGVRWIARKVTWQQEIINAAATKKAERSP